MQFTGDTAAFFILNSKDLAGKALKCPTLFSQFRSSQIYAGTMRQRCHHKLASSATVTASLYAGCNGVPAYFPKDLFPDLLKIKGDVGARDLIRYARGVKLHGGGLDIDTNEDLVHAQRLFG